ncbi:hypothetical protein [Staphylococcus arlettae]|uniref:hypothetical protein n=1 Tax=Staphylococcus arlettae TaxID=29378 RepID=UPI0021D024E8|nr:hypothetical protein [Staphylococcus arlettae]UXU53170.1 hypothetical protein MUA71_03575 [Staphylococcus arlettae]
MQILEVNRYEFITEYKVKTTKGIFMHSVTNETTHFDAKEEIKHFARKMEK